MVEIHCVKCNARLFDLESTGRVEGMVIRCHKCSYDNKVKILKINNEIHPKGEIEEVVFIE